MRVIGGKFSGRKLEKPETDKTRPTADMVKEAVFTKFQFAMDGARFLDLFSGSGQIAIEALSRGASVVAVDKSSVCKKTILANAKGLDGDFKFFQTDYQVALEKLAGECFDFIYIDPPYENHDCYDISLKLIYGNKLLTENGFVICEHRSDSQIKTDLFEIVKSKKYGTKTLTYLKNIAVELT